MSWLIGPAEDRPKLRRVVARIDAILGYPRTHAESELRRRGSGPWAPTVRTETQCAVMRHDLTGATILQGAIAISLDEVTDALRDRFVEIDGVRKRVRQWIADQGWEVRADLPGALSAWSELQPRDGEAGSADGVPIPDGEE